MGKKATAKKSAEMTEEEFDRWWDERVKGVNFDNREESYNFYLNFDACLICGEVATHWTPAKADGWLMPACDKHFNDTKITERRWANARVRAEKSAEFMADLKCCKCGGRPVMSFIDMWMAPDLVTKDTITSLGLPLCDKCSLSDEWLTVEYDVARVKEARNRLQEQNIGIEFKFERGQIAASEKLLDEMEKDGTLRLEKGKTHSGGFDGFVWKSFDRHCLCDWGDISQEDREKNNRALQTKGGLLSIYKHDKYPTIGIFTEANGSQTVIGLQDDFCED